MRSSRYCPVQICFLWMILIDLFRKDDDGATLIITHGLNLQLGISGRRLEIFRNSSFWRWNYKFDGEYIHTLNWRTLLRIQYSFFKIVANDIRILMKRSATIYRIPVLWKKQLAALLMAASNCTYRRIANQLEMGSSTVLEYVHAVLRAIWSTYASELSLSSSVDNIAALMNRFVPIARLPYCIGAIDGIRIPSKNAQQHSTTSTVATTDMRV